MRTNERCLYSAPVRLLSFLVLLTQFAGLSGATAQTAAHKSYYAQRNTLGVFGAYSPNSSHILLGDAENRMLVNIGFVYNRRLFTNPNVNLRYSGELLPVALESDPLGLYAQNQTAPTAETMLTNSSPVVTCTPLSMPYSFIDPRTGVTYSGTTSLSCRGRRWVAGEAISPVGLQGNFLPERKTQPFLGGHGGYMYSTQQIPITGAGSFNFTFDIDAGVEFYRSNARSLRVEYRYHHISNHNTAPLNPGIDNGLIQFTYCFGWGR